MFINRHKNGVFHNILSVTKQKARKHAFSKVFFFHSFYVQVDNWLKLSIRSMSADDNYVFIYVIFTVR